jgi:hypothetical protein
MSGLLRRLTRRRPATADETRSPESSEPVGAPAETPAEPGGDRPVPASDQQATQVLPATADQPAGPEPQPAPASSVRDLPAGIDPGELADAPAPSASRGKLRRRLRYLRRVRELLLRDLGGFVFELHRTAGDAPQEAQQRLLQAKTNRLAALDAELRGLESRLGRPHEGTLLREPGIGGLCPECGELHASDAHYCARCGTPLDAKARAQRDAAMKAAAQPAPQESAPASVLWAAGSQRAAEAEKPDPSAATSEWLALPGKPADSVATRPAPQGEPTGEPAAAGHDRPTVANEPAAKEEPAGRDEPPTPDEPDGTQPRKPASENGRRDEDVPPPVADPLTSRPEQGS